MSSSLAFVKNTSLAAIGLLAVFVGGGAIAVVLDAITWEDLGDWTVKAVSVAVVVVILSAVLGAISGTVGPKSK